jgi:hypothetical protein
MGNKEYIDCQSLRNKWGMYEVGGILYNSDSRDWTFYVDNLKKQYADKGCGKDALMEKCLEREAYLTNLRESINAKAQQGNFTFVEGFTKILDVEKQKFSDLGCQKKIEENRRVAVLETIDKYSELDKQRIESDNKYQVKFRIFMGASVLLIVVTTILLLSKKE